MLVFLVAAMPGAVGEVIARVGAGCSVVLGVPA